ncbi:hypothetical protein EVAR_80315_1 [Eumeta japonica]|uniref:Uncharacterized protein n=1 Tax=Eumeta variegata TaxID=151549 RepID=A0A4C1UBH3_EUMVA|nr:hypothetical protein EVAR_80315_1 [Eumeta japonica]
MLRLPKRIHEVRTSHAPAIMRVAASSLLISAAPEHCIVLKRSRIQVSQVPWARCAAQRRIASDTVLAIATGRAFTKRAALVSSRSNGPDPSRCPVTSYAETIPLRNHPEGGEEVMCLRHPRGLFGHVR